LTSVRPFPILVAYNDPKRQKKESVAVPEDNRHEIQSGESPGIDSEPRLEEPRMFRVILHNDHYTTMDFVVEVLMKVFHKTAAEAIKIMLDVHRKGAGVCGAYIYDIAVTKVSQVHHMARKHEFPLKCSYEEA
jgi:ATP-dependent Clp protease adaptor protein ClpS